MSLRLEIKRAFAERTVKVYSVDLHPTEPRMLWSLASGNVCIRNFQSKPAAVVSVQLSKHSVPVRSAKFVPGKQWILADSDNIFLNVINYSTGDILKSWVAHDDYISCISVHPSLPHFLSSSNDGLIKLWKLNDNDLRLAETFEGHADGVTHVSFNPKGDSTFASASCDSTVKMWSSGSAHPNHTFQHEGVNCVGYFTASGTPYLITGSGSAKVWDYQKKSCIDTLGSHTLGGYQHNISSIGLQPDLPIIITGSKDGKIRIWNTRNYRLEKTLNLGLGGVCTLGYTKGSRRLAIGYEKGLVVIEIAREPSIPSMDSKGNVIWVKDNLHTTNLNANVGSEVIEGEVLLSGTELGKSDLYLQSLKYSPDGRFLGACGDGNYIIYATGTWKQKTFGDALDFTWSSAREYAIRDKTSQVKIFNKSFQEKKNFKPTIAVERIFGGYLLSLSSTNCIQFYDWADGRLLRQFEMNVRNVYWAHSADMVAIASNVSLFIYKFNKGRANETFELLHELNELVRSANWVGDNFVYINSAWRLNCYTATGGEVFSMSYPMYHLERPFHMLGYLPDRTQLYLFDKDMKIVGYPVVKILMEYKKLVMRGDLEAANSLLKSIPEIQHNSVAHFLESRGFLREAYEISADAEHKFRLAAKIGTLEIEEVGPIHKNIGLSEIPIRMSQNYDFEFSWKDNLLHGQYIVPAVRDQEGTSSCVFQSLCGAADMEKLRTAAGMDPSTTTDIRFSASRFVADYEAIAGPVPLDEDHKRLPTALSFFEEKGVLAEGGGAPPQRYKIASSQQYDDLSFAEVAALISEGKPVIGGLRVDTNFKTLKPEDIYDYSSKDAKTTVSKKIVSHAVVFIGFGQRDGRLYLVFLNSHGTDFGDKGFGRVYFEHIRHFTTIEF